VTAVDDYLEAMPAHEWDRLAGTLAEDVHREGPFADVVTGRGPYVEFLSRVIPSLKDYRLRVIRTSWSGDRLAYVELTETLEADGVRTEYPEVVVFGLDDAGLISQVSVYMKYPGGPPAVKGGRAT
jgi:hypothetical protein